MPLRGNILYATDKYTRPDTFRWESLPNCAHSDNALNDGGPKGDLLKFKCIADGHLESDGEISAEIAVMVCCNSIRQISKSHVSFSIFQSTKLILS